MEDFDYQDEELNEIEYYEIVSLNEIIKNNPTFVAFSNDEIYNHLFNFLKSKNKSSGFLNLFNSIINKQRNPNNINNFIILTDATRNNYQDEDIEEFILKIKQNNKEQINISFKNKNKIWFPLNYDPESTLIKFNPSQTSILQLSTDDNFIIFKDDERDIPILGAYFYEPNTPSSNYLNENIVASSIHKERYKGTILKIDDKYKSFNELIADYKIPIPLHLIQGNDDNEYHYGNLASILNRYNYDLNMINTDDFKDIKTHLESLASKEKDVKINYSHIPIKKIELSNNRIYFYDKLKSIKKLIDITYKSTTEITKKINVLLNEKTPVDDNKLLSNLNYLIHTIDESNYNEIINKLQEIRKNLSIDNYVNTFKNSNEIDMKMIDDFFKNMEDKYNILHQSFKDIFDIKFTFEPDEHEIKLGLDIKDYEGVPVRVDDFKKNAVYIDELNDDDDEGDVKPTENIEFNKYFNNYYYNLEKGFIEALKTFIIPFILKIQELSKLPLTMDIIISHLFNLYKGKIPEKFIIIKEKYGDKYDTEYYKTLSQKSIKFVLTSQDEDPILKDAYIEYVSILIDMIYDVICKWSIEIQKEIINETLLFNRERCYVPCIDKWNDFGAPYDMNVKEKDGVLYYLICIFQEVYKEVFSENDDNYLPLDKNYKNIIIDKLKNEYKTDLEQFISKKDKYKKINKGYEAQKKLVQFLQSKDKSVYKDNKFFENFIEALIYMPSVKYEKIHKYLLGCCLERIDENFSADTYLQINRKDLEKAKSKFSSERVLNKPRYKRFYLTRDVKNINLDKFSPIIFDDFSYDIIDISIQEWFDSLKSYNTYLNEKQINDIQMKLRDTYNIHTNYYIQSLFNKKLDIKGYNFQNYKQILLSVSKTLYTNLNNKIDSSILTNMIQQIHQTILTLDNLSSIVNDDNMMEIIQIRTILVIRGLCLPSSPDISTNAKLIPIIKIDNELSKLITNEIISKVAKIIQDSQMPTLEEQINYINKLREENKNKVLATLNKKTSDEKDIFKELKKIGIDYDDVDEIRYVNGEKKEEGEMDGEREYEIGEEDDMMDDDYLDAPEYGFIYAD